MRLKYILLATLLLPVKKMQERMNSIDQTMKKTGERVSINEKTNLSVRLA
jgi:hypothetical protein